MKKIAFILVVLLFVSAHAFAQGEALTNKSIFDMMGLGFSEDVIVAKIEASEADFDTSMESLKTLKEKGVSDKVIVAIINSAYAKEEEENANTSNDRLGIYVNEGGKLEKIFPTVFSGQKTNTLGTAMSYGLASSSIHSVLDNPTSTNIIRNTNPEFIFFFPKGGNANNNNFVGMNNWWFFAATSPNEFVLARLNKKRKKRELKVGSVNIYSGINQNVNDESIVQFDIINVNDYTFKVIPSIPLEVGEYCFLYRGSANGSAYVNQSVFDFSIPEGYETSTKYKVGDSVWILMKGKPKHCDVYEIERKKDGVYYTLYPRFFSSVQSRIESECYPTKQELIDALSEKEE